MGLCWNIRLLVSTIHASFLVSTYKCVLSSMAVLGLNFFNHNRTKRHLIQAGQPDKGKIYLLEPSIRKWSIVGNPYNPMCGKWEKNFLQWITTLDTYFSECLRLRYSLGRIPFSSTAYVDTYMCKSNQVAKLIYYWWEWYRTVLCHYLVPITDFFECRL